MWRYSGQTRYQISAICNWAFILLYHLHTTQHLSQAIYLKKNADGINFAYDVTANPQDYAYLGPDQIALQEAYVKQWQPELIAFENSGMTYVLIFYLQWMYVFQLFFQGTFAGRTKRQMKYWQSENIVDTIIFLCGLSYLVIILRDYRNGTFLKDMTENEEAKFYFDNYMDSPVKENYLLFGIALLFWIKAVMQLRFLEMSGTQYQMILQFVPDLKSFMALFVVSILTFSLVGMLIFRESEDFASLMDAFMLLTSDPLMKIEFYLFPDSFVGTYVGYLFFWSYLAVNFFLVRNVIVAQLSTTYNIVRKAGNTLYLLTTLSVREVSEADGKYSAVVSAPFPLTVLNLLFGSIVLAAKSPWLNEKVLHLYYFPVMLVLVCVFTAWQIIIFPFAYLKVAGHKWALVIKAPKGSGSSSSLDRAGQAILFQIIGPILMLGTIVTDTYWFVIHLYKMDLDKSVTSKS